MHLYAGNGNTLAFTSLSSVENPESPYWLAVRSVMHLVTLLFCFVLPRYDLNEKMLSACNMLKSHLSDPKTLSSKDVVR